jgi:4-amino-4-deoxy-L-arabinose transferase-like glycosyltransferase
MSRTVVEEAEPQVDSSLAGPDGRSIKPTLAQGTCIAAILLLFFVAEVHNASLRLFWFDELGTLYVTVRPTLREMFQAMPSDGNPPLYFLFARLCLHLPLKTELAMRLPSILAFQGTALAVFLFVRRIASFQFALMSMCLLLGSVIGERFAVEARAYALMTLFTAVLLCCWQTATRRDESADRKWSLVGIYVCTAGAILSHQYGILYSFLPLVAGEAARWFGRRRLDFGVPCSWGLGALTILFTYPPMLHGQRTLLAAIRNSPNFGARPMFGDLGTYGEMWPLIVPFLLPIVIVPWAFIQTALLRRTSKPIEPPSLRAKDLAVADMLALMLPLMLLITHFGTGFFVDRYAIGSALGISMLAGILAALGSGRWPQLRVLVSLVSLYSVVIGIALLWAPTASYSHATDYGEALFRSVPGTEPIVVASSLQFPPAWWYADQSLRRRIHYLSDLKYAEQSGDVLPEYSLFVERWYSPMHMDDYATFMAQHRGFLVYSIGRRRSEWLMERLSRDGWDLNLINADRNGKIYRATAPMPRVASVR